MTTKQNKIFIAVFVCFIALLVLAANPTFTNFDTTQFNATTSPAYVGIKSGAPITNAALTFARVVDQIGSINWSISVDGSASFNGGNTAWDTGGNITSVSYSDNAGTSISAGVVDAPIIKDTGGDQMSGGNIVASTDVTAGQDVNCGAFTTDSLGNVHLFSITFTSANTPAILSGTGDPTGVVNLPQGSLWLRVDGGALTTLYVNVSGGPGGWLAK